MTAELTFDAFDDTDFSARDQLNDPAFLTALRLQMVKFATLQLQDASRAEDVVQEAMLNALQKVDAFRRQSALKTWVFAILKNKIIDHLRQNARQVNASSLCQDEAMEQTFSELLFDQGGHWHKHERPAHWDQPDHDTENNQFWRIFDTCLNRLPANYGRFFMMREFLELSTDEICHNEQLNQNSLNVTLYRARLRLRECLENNWYCAEEIPQ